MTADIDKDSLPEIQRVMEFFLARQPILNRDQDLIAYELLFRRTRSGSAEVVDDRMATASVIANAANLGMSNVIGSSLGFVNVDASVLMSDFISFLPPDKVVLEILETVEALPEVLDRVAELTRAGYLFALDDVVADTEDIRQLLPLVAIVKIDITGMKQDELAALADHFIHAGKKLLAEKVESLEQFKLCHALGFDYFQGYYFSKPIIMRGKALSPSQLTIMKLMTQLVADAENAEIERSFKQDASLGLNLLRLVNTPGAGVTHRINSLSQALFILGRRQLQRWLQILLYSKAGRSSSALSPLLVLASTRGRLLELLAQKLRPGNRAVADTAFSVGIMSLLDTLFSAPMMQILQQIGVSDDISNALLHRDGFYGDILQLAEHMEQIEKASPLLGLALDKLELPIEEFYALQVDAYAWSDSISQGAA